MRLRTNILIAALFLQVIGWAQAPISIHELREKAIAHSHIVKQKQLNSDAAREQIKIAEAQRWATIDASGTYLSVNKIVTDDRNFNDNQYYSGGLTITQPLYMGGKIQKNILFAESQELMSKSIVDLSINEIVYNADILYWSFVANDEIYNSWVQYEAYMKNFVTEVRDKVDAELSGRNELIRAQVQYNNVLDNTADAKKMLEISKMKINYLIGSDLMAPVETLDKALPLASDVPSNINGIETALENNPEIKIAEQAVETSQIQTELVLSKYLPQVGLTVLPSYNNGLLQKANGIGIVAGLTVSVPIYHWGQKRHEKSKAEAQIMASEEGLLQAQEDLALELMQSYQELMTGSERVNISKLTVDEARENLEFAENRYYGQVAPLIEVTDAQSLLQQAFLGHIGTKINFYYALTSYYNALGSLQSK